jgi:MarR family transcriptional regulator, 2-MHQ and catechol-resistance regulon repressor
MQNISGSHNVGAQQSDGIAGAAAAHEPAALGESTRDEPKGRAFLERELLDAMASFSPRDRGILRAWHRHSISLVHLNVLTSLEVESPLSMKRLAESMDISDASATGIVDRMEKRGLVERRHDTSDRRVVFVYPTDMGATVFRDMDAHRRDFMARVFAELTDTELSALLTGMRAVQAARSNVLAAIQQAQDGAEKPETPVSASD